MKWSVVAIVMLYLSASNAFETEEEIELKRRLALENDDCFEGDIMIKSEEDRSAAIKGDSRRWPNAVIPFSVDPQLAFLRPTIDAAMWHIQNLTCLTFKESNTEANRVHLVRQPGCKSQLGKAGGKQLLHLGQLCEPIGTVVHELLHAAGFLHEHTRSDRDNYVTIIRSNIEPGKEHNFDKMPGGDVLFGDFDYDSIMIYGETAFSIDPRLRTIIPKQSGVKLTNPYAKRGMTRKDAAGVRQLYNC